MKNAKWLKHQFVLTASLVLLIPFTFNACKVTGGEDELLNSFIDFSSLGLIKSDCASIARVDEPAYGCNLSITTGPDVTAGEWAVTSKHSCSWLNLSADGSITGQPLTSHIGDCLLSVEYLNTADNAQVDEINIPIKVEPSLFVVIDTCGYSYPPGAPNRFACTYRVQSSSLPVGEVRYSIDMNVTTCQGFILPNLFGNYIYTEILGQNCVLGITVELLDYSRTIKYSRIYNIQNI